MTRDEWEKEGTELFGPDLMQWRFVCPACGHRQTVQDYKDAGAPPEAVAFSCVGRYLSKKKRVFSLDGIEQEKGPCDYAGGGLLRLNPKEVDGQMYFDFAPKEDGNVSKTQD